VIIRLQNVGEMLDIRLQNVYNFDGRINYEAKIT
jgi:hypothetical protein